MRTRNFQSRMSAKLDNINKKLIDNVIRWIGHSTDVIKIKLLKTVQGDLINREIVDVQFREVVFPPLENVPLRRIERDGDHLRIDTLYLSTLSEKTPIEIYSTVENPLSVGDLLIQGIYDDNTDLPSIIVFEVKTCFGTFGGRKLLLNKYHVTYADESFGEHELQIITDAMKRRTSVKW